MLTRPQRLTFTFALVLKYEQVEVKADAALVQDTVSSLGEAVTQRQILDLPLDGRNFSQLGTLAAGRGAINAWLTGGGRTCATKSSLRG